MSKAQINYLLVLATLFIVWLYFGTFLMAAKIDHKMNLASGMGRPMMGDWSQRQPFAMPGFPKSQGGASVNQPSAMPSGLTTLPSGFQKLADAQKAQGAVPAKKK